MSHSAARIACTAFFATVCSTTSSAQAGARQLEGGFSGGVVGHAGSQAGIGGLVAAHGAVRPNDWLRVYARLEYGLGAGLDRAGSPRHHAAFAAGAAYVFDVLSVAPWFGLGVVGSYEASPTWGGALGGGFLLGGEGRLGVDVLLSRYFALTFQGSAAIFFNDFDRNWGAFSGSAGVRWALDL